MRHVIVDNHKEDLGFFNLSEQVKVHFPVFVKSLTGGGSGHQKKKFCRSWLLAAKMTEQAKKKIIHDDN